MTPMEIALLVIGVIIFALSFFLPAGKEKKTEKDIQEEQEEIRKLMEKELDGMKLKVNAAASESADLVVDKIERSLEKVSNEKIMAVDEYGQTIIDEINKNHQEVMFLYDMLKDKHTDLTNQVRKADAAAKEIKTLSATAINASKGLQQELRVASVTKKGLTDEQRAVFDDVDEPVSITTPQKVVGTDYSQASASFPQASQAVQTTATAAVFETATAAAPANGYGSPVIETVQPSIEPVQPAVHEKKTEVRDLLSGMHYTATDNTLTPKMESSNNNQKILELHKQGMATVDIARELKLGVGEVKLVIDLFK